MSEVESRSGLARFLSVVNTPAGRALIALLLVLAFGAYFNADGAFFKYSTHRDALRGSSVYGILACGMTLVIITGGIDLAVGSIVALASVCCSIMAIHWGWSAWTVVPLTLLIGATAGGVSGTITSALRVQPFIATLAMMVFARGLAKYVCGGEKVSRSILLEDGTTEYVDLPQLFQAIDKRILGDNVSVVTIIFLVCFFVAYALLAKHRWGRELYAIGGNEEASRLSGVPVVFSKTMAYVASGVLAAIAGICQAAQEQQGDPEAGTAYELVAIAMVVVGGTNLMGGRGGMGLTLLGVLTIGYVDKILSINSYPESYRLMLTGIIIVAAVLTQQRRRN